MNEIIYIFMIAFTWGLICFSVGGLWGFVKGYEEAKDEK